MGKVHFQSGSKILITVNLSQVINDNSAQERKSLTISNFLIHEWQFFFSWICQQDTCLSKDPALIRREQQERWGSRISITPLGSSIGCFISLSWLTFLWWLSHVYQPAAFLLPWDVKSTSTCRQKGKSTSTTPVSQTQGCASLQLCPAGVSTTDSRDLADCPRKNTFLTNNTFQSFLGKFHFWFDSSCCFM